MSRSQDLRPRGVVRVGVLGCPHAPQPLPHEQRQHHPQEREASGYRPHQQGVEDPVPAVWMRSVTLRSGHRSLPFRMAATVPASRLLTEARHLTMGTETLQHDTAVSASEHPLRVRNLWVLACFNKGKSAPGNFRNQYAVFPVAACLMTAPLLASRPHADHSLSSYLVHMTTVLGRARRTENNHGN